jgi:hypothetical protein
MKLKHESLGLELTKIRPRLKIILEHLDSFFKEHGQTLTITDVLSDPMEDKKLKRVSNSHSQGRAFDFRTKGIPQEFLRKVENVFEEKYKKWAAISSKTKLPNLIYYHGEGDNHHGHVQIM